ncbi:MAG: PEP/pyruvate-binding domain-containing protein, partial [bacterium]|nr:PEP/pyruvate-binding domain-containing protein [bacterium]
AEAVAHLATIEPLVGNYIHDRLRGSPLLFCTAVLDSLIADADIQLGIGHRFFGQPLGTGLRGLNAGLARGVLRVAERQQHGGHFDNNAIYLLPATTADLPPVAGIMTAGEGNALSHVQLLARNLGIPNVVVEKSLLDELKDKEGENVVLAVSPLGVVEIDYATAEWDRVFGQVVKPTEELIRPDLDKLNLKKQRFIPLRRLQASDSGRIAGPKAANLGELKKRFPEAVTSGLVIPFGVFRALLDQPMEPRGPSIFAWMEAQYRLIASLEAQPGKQREATDAFLKKMRRTILEADPGDKFRRKLRRSLEKHFGPDGSYGVFVRSDTNLEDLPQFTGAGLNLTVPHVVGFENILKAISQVWASPFTERAYAWRQSYMTEPEHVYVSVLLLKSVPVEKSGVMVTQNLETGSPEWLSIAVSQGVGGAVEGQGAEELRIHTESGAIRLMAQATEPWRRVLRPEGGVARMPSEIKDHLLGAGEMEQLTGLARSVHRHFPALHDNEGNALPADIEFGFLEGRMVLFQIRPFLESKRASRSNYLNALDKKLEIGRTRRVNLNERPSARVL